MDYPLADAAGGADPSAPSLAALTGRLADEDKHPTSLAPPYDGRAIFAAARGGDALARVEVSSLGEAAVLTGALAVGLRSALDSVFARRGRPVAA